MTLVGNNCIILYIRKVIHYYYYHNLRKGEDIMPVITNFKCPNCSAPLLNLKSTIGKCEYCDTPYTIEEAQTYQDCISAEGIHSGVSFTADSETEHNYLVDYLTQDNNAPLDILTASQIESVEALVLPAYYYHYNGTSDFMCDIGNVNKKYLSGEDGKTKSVNETTWSTITGNTRTDKQGIVSGNKDFDEIVKAMYEPYESDTLTDVESLQIPFNAVTIRFDRPSSSVLNDFIKPSMLEALKESAVKQLGDRMQRNLTLGNPNIQSDNDIEKVIVGAYKVTLTHNGNKYIVYISPNGKNIYYVQSPPFDENRKKAIEEKQLYLGQLLNKNSKLTALIVISVILGIILISTVIVPLAGIAGIVYAVMQKKKLKPEIEKAQQDYEDEKNRLTAVKNEFVNSNSKLNGYEKL